jgi:hypothetical protein
MRATYRVIVPGKWLFDCSPSSRRRFRLAEDAEPRGQIDARVAEVLGYVG